MASVTDTAARERWEKEAAKSPQRDVPPTTVRLVLSAGSQIWLVQASPSPEA